MDPCAVGGCDEKLFFFDCAKNILFPSFKKKDLD